MKKIRLAIGVTAVAAALTGTSAIAQQDQMSLDRSQLPAAVGQVPDKAPVPGNAQVAQNGDTSQVQPDNTQAAPVPPADQNNYSSTAGTNASDPKSRAEVYQELQDAARNGNVPHGDQGLTKKDQLPYAYPGPSNPVPPVDSGGNQVQ
jgi:hypothetical protein